MYHQRNILLVYIFLFFLRFTIAAAVSQRFTHGLQRSVGRTAHALRIILCHPHRNKLNFRLALPSPQETKLNPRRPGAAQENQVSTRNTCCLNSVSRGEGSSLGNGKLVYGCVVCCGHFVGPAPAMLLRRIRSAAATPATTSSTPPGFAQRNLVNRL